MWEHSDMSCCICWYFCLYCIFVVQLAIVALLENPLACIHLERASQSMRNMHCHFSWNFLHWVSCLELPWFAYANHVVAMWRGMSENLKKVGTCRLDISYHIIAAGAKIWDKHKHWLTNTKRILELGGPHNKVLFGLTKISYNYGTNTRIYRYCALAIFLYFHSWLRYRATTVVSNHRNIIQASQSNSKLVPIDFVLKSK